MWLDDDDDDRLTFVAPCWGPIQPFPHYFAIRDREWSKIVHNERGTIREEEVAVRVRVRPGGKE